MTDAATSPTGGNKTTVAEAGRQMLLNPDASGGGCPDLSETSGPGRAVRLGDRLDSADPR
jgi:hypothetical protein